jgi:hypothetical protein
MRVSACRRRYAPLTMSKLLEKALFQVSDIAPLTFPPFSVYLMLRAREMIRKKPRHTGPPAAGFDIPLPGGVFSGMSVIQSCGINFARLPGSRLSPNKMLLSWMTMERSWTTWRARSRLHAGEGHLRRLCKTLAEGAHPLVSGGQDS